MSYLIGHCSALGWTALKALLLFAVTVIGLRLSQRRILAELNVFDLAVIVAVGAIIGRTATSSTTSFATGAVALATLLVAHRVVAELHCRRWFTGLLDRRPLILLAHGRLQPEALRSAGLTPSDVYRLLRQAGHGDLDRLEYALYEENGHLTVVRADQLQGQAVQTGLTEAGLGETH
jgi:uncharacterized membrane protein YcaP (DUF421 family)